jgi:DNA-binding transcriptional MerR regulator
MTATTRKSGSPSSYTISRLGRLCGVSRSTLLYYNAIGLLSPTARSITGYRLYDEAARQRLEQIILFRSVGIPLAQIRALLSAPASGPAAVLIRRLMEINGQIEDLRGKQQAILDLLRQDGSLAGAKRRLRAFTALGRRAGIYKGNYLSVHRLFEKSSPELHRKVLKFLGFTEGEIRKLISRL